MQSTIKIFRHFVNNISPVTPADMFEKVNTAVEYLENNGGRSTEEVEEMMIKFGYELWPWNKAYREFLILAEDEVGEHFLLPRLTTPLQDKFFNYKDYGLTWRDFYSGRLLPHYFSAEERLELMPAFVEMRRDLRHYVSHQILGLARADYLNRVEGHRSLLEKIKMSFQKLRDLASRATHHGNFSKDIEARVRGFEYGLCFLGPELKYRDVEEAVDYFHGRERELSAGRGIHMPLEVEFY